MKPDKPSPEFACPYPIQDYPLITMAHGGGGKFTARLIDQIFKPAFGSSAADNLHDGALLNVAPGKLAFTTDSYVIRPLFFRGGDIGKLSVVGTSNDLSMCGARPLYLSCGFVLEEGFAVADLIKIVRSMKNAADEVGALIVTGDTKVVEKGKGDGIYINTAGIGQLLLEPAPFPSEIKAGDKIILSGDIGRHGVSILSQRDGLQFEVDLESDCAHLYPAVEALKQSGIRVHCLRDLTRGGLATTLVELAEQSGRVFSVVEDSIPVSVGVSSACEILGLEAIYVANEGRFAAIVDPADCEKAISILRAIPVSREACLIGEVQDSTRGPRVIVQTGFGVNRVIDRLSGEQLPRIC